MEQRNKCYKTWVGSDSSTEIEAYDHSVLQKYYAKMLKMEVLECGKSENDRNCQNSFAVQNVKICVLEYLKQYVNLNGQQVV